MNKRDVLLEIGLEEMPARFVRDAMNQLSDKITKWLLENNISFDQIKGYSSPRRLAVVITDVSEKQEDVELEAKGPAKNIAVDNEENWSKAAIGFTRGQGASVDDIYFKEINGIEYAHVKKFIQGQETSQSLVDLQQIITNLSFPKNMKWGSEDLRFVRPIKWLVALFGKEIIPFTISTVSTGNKTMGHRFLGGEVEITSPREYESILMSQYVIADYLERKEAITSQIRILEEENNWIVPIDEDLLEEVTNLVEYPTAFFGKYEEEFLSLPEKVLITSMKEHQRYFPVKDQNGKLLPYFVAVRNGDHKHLEVVAKGNEKVLRARLSDADFFYKEDQKLKIENLLKKLDSIVYQVELGSLGDKVRRIQTISSKLGNILRLDSTTQEMVNRAAQICKFDLVTNMVYEFPELQGYMGEKYARFNGEKEAVASAINEHYMPRHAEDSVPSTTIGAIVSIADKLDTITGCFSIGLIPSGSQDPYALRRQAAGIVQILLDKQWDVSIEELFELSVDLFTNKTEKRDICSDLDQFFKLRLKNELSNRGIRYDIIDAVLSDRIGNIGLLIKKAEVLESKKEDSSFKEVIESLSRILNIAKKGEKVDIDPTLFVGEEEKALYERYNHVRQGVQDALTEGNALNAFNELSSMSTLIDQYFENTMVMAEDEKVKKNRLAQMVHLAHTIKLFADMNTIIVK